MKRLFKSEQQNKELTHSQISKTLNPKRLRGPSDADPAHVQRQGKLYSSVSKRIEILEIEGRCQQVQSLITDFLGPARA